MGPWIAFAALLIRPTSTAFTRRDWRGQENIPLTGGVILAANHVSHVDPFLLAHFVYGAGRVPRFMAKDSLFTKPVIGVIMRGAGQIPVHRYSGDASDALRSARAAVERGEAVIIYPEGTITKDPYVWPMLARTGVARLAAGTGAPVIPIAQWGARQIYDPLRRTGWRRWLPKLLPRASVTFVAGPPVDFSRWAGQQPTAPVLREMTLAVMGWITDQVAQLRGEPVPQLTWDPRRGSHVPAPPVEPDAGEPLAG